MKTGLTEEAERNWEQVEPIPVHYIYDSGPDVETRRPSEITEESIRSFGAAVTERTDSLEISSPWSDVIEPYFEEFDSYVDGIA